MYDFTELTEIEFLDFAEQQESFNYLQTAEMKKLREARDAEGFYLGLRNGKKEIQLASLAFSVPVRFGRKFEISGGPLGELTESLLTAFTEELKKFAKAHDAIYLEMEPNRAYRLLDDDGQALSEDNTALLDVFQKAGYEHQGFYQRYEGGLPRFWYVKNLEKLTNETLVKSFTKDGQYSLKKAKKFGTQVRRLEYDELDKFKALTEAAAEHHDFHDKDLAYYQQFYKSFGEKADFLVAELNFETYKEGLKSEIALLQTKIAASSSAKKEKQRTEFAAQIAAHEKRLTEADELSRGTKGTTILSGGLFIYNPRETVYLFSGTIEKYRSLYAPYLIQEEIMRRTMMRQIPRYNFLGVQGIFDGTDGVLRFKESFSGYIQENIGKFTLVIRPAKYRMISTLKKVLRR